MSESAKHCIGGNHCASKFDPSIGQLLSGNSHLVPFALGSDQVGGRRRCDDRQGLCTVAFDRGPDQPEQRDLVPRLHALLAIRGRVRAVRVLPVRYRDLLHECHSPCQKRSMARQSRDNCSLQDPSRRLPAHQSQALQWDRRRGVAERDRRYRCSGGVAQCPRPDDPRWRGLCWRGRASWGYQRRGGFDRHCSRHGRDQAIEPNPLRLAATSGRQLLVQHLSASWSSPPYVGATTTRGLASEAGPGIGRVTVRFSSRDLHRCPSGPFAGNLQRLHRLQQGGQRRDLSQSPQAQIHTSTPTFIRTDLRVPVFLFETESDLLSLGYLAARQPSTPYIHEWETAGTAHDDTYGLLSARTDTGNGVADADAFQSMLNPPSDPIPGIVDCSAPINAGSHTYELRAAMAAVNHWVASGVVPRQSPRLEVNPANRHVFLTDRNGNALGGIRTPQVQAPVATLSGIGQPGATPVASHPGSAVSGEPYVGSSAPRSRSAPHRCPRCIQTTAPSSPNGTQRRPLR